MKVMLLLYDVEDYWEQVSPEQMGEAVAEHRAFGEFLARRGVVFSAEAVKPSSEARTLRPEGDVVDGPFVPSRQELAGFYLVECEDLDEAVELARHCPMGAGIEVRPVWDG
jgi:hypothetical protein